MKTTLNRMKVALLTASLAVAEQSKDMRATRDAARIGLAAGSILGPCVASAQGFITGFQNLGTLAQLGVGLLIAIGLLGGLGLVMGGLFSMYKKYDNRGDDITWGKVGVQIAAGGLMMALGWVGTNVVETLGGSSSDIGKSLK